MTTAECERVVGELRAVKLMLERHYPLIAGHVISLQERMEDRAAAAWLEVAQDVYAAITGHDERIATR